VTVLQPRAPAPEINVDDGFREAVQNGLSEAEQVILLHRDAKKHVERTTTEKFIQ